MEEFTICNAKQKDIPKIISLFADAYNDNYISHGEIQLGIANNETSLNPEGLTIKKKELETLLDSPDAFIRVAYSQSKHTIAGVAISNIISDYPWSTKYGVIADIVVDSGFRRLGIGQKLVEDAERLLRMNSARDIFIEINNENVVSQSFFSKLGYKTISMTACKRLDV